MQKKHRESTPYRVMICLEMDIIFSLLLLFSFLPGFLLCIGIFFFFPACMNLLLSSRD